MEVNVPSTHNNTLPYQAFSTLFHNMFDAIVIYNYETEKIKDCNSSCIKLLGYSKDELLTLNRFDLMPRYSSLYPKIDIHEIIRTDHRLKVMKGESIYSRGELVSKYGTNLIAELNIVPTGSKTGEAFVIIHDITQSLENSINLNLNKEKYQAIVDNACESIIYLDLETRQLIECNSVVTKMFKVPNKQILLEKDPHQFYSTSDKELNHMSARHFFRKCVYQAIREGNSSNEFVAQRMDGSEFIAEISTVYVKSKNSKGKAIFFIRDISNQYLAQKERDRLYHEQQQILDSMPIQFSQKDLKNNIVKANEAMREFLDASVDSIDGRNISTLMSKDDAHRIWQEDLSIAETKEPKLNIIFSMVNNENKKVWSRIDKVPFFDERGEVKGILSYVVNITDLMESQEQTKQSERSYRALFDNAFDGIMVYDCNINRIIKCNLKLADYLSTEAEIITRSQLADFSPEFQNNGLKSTQHFEEMVRKTKKRGSYQAEWFFELNDNSPLIAAVNTYLIPQNDVCHIVFIFKDVTDEKEREIIIRSNVAELNKKNVELTKYIESNKQLDNFAAIASHDLQAPLRTIHSYTQLLQKSIENGATKQQREFMHFITNATSNMRHLIRDLRTFSKVDSTKLHIRSINSDFMLEEVLAELKATIDYTKTVVHVPSNLPTIYGDRIKLKQLFQNLITNAIKYMGKDTIPNVNILFEETEDKWYFKIQDNGIGIAPENQKKIFQLFHRLHSNDEYAGTGIGLSLCKKVVDQHFGEIGVESEFGKGSTFYFYIPKDVEIKIKELM